MGDKYLQSKQGSLEEIATKIAVEQPTIVKQQPKVTLQAQSYFGMKENSLADVAAKVVSEETEYQAKFKKELEKTGKSIAQMSDTEKKAFFDKLDSMHQAKNETHTFTTDVINKKQKDTKGEKEVINPIKEGKMKDIATDQSELKRLNARLSQLKDKKAADQGDTTDIEKDILQTQRSIKDVQIRLKNVPKEVKENIIKEFGGEPSGGGKYALDAIKAKRLRLQDELDNLNKKDPNYKEKSANLKKQIETQKEIMARKQREVYGSYDPTLKKEAVDNAYAVGMSAAMKQTGDKPPLKKSTITKAHDIAKSIEKDQKNEQVDQKSVDKFHTALDKLVHKTFGKSSDETKKESDEVPAGYHKMPNGKIMKDSEHKKDESKKSYYEMKKQIRAEVEKGKATMTGKTPAVIDTQPQKPII